MSVLLRVAYDGTHFHGFARQPQPGSPRTVQGQLEQALSTLYKVPVVTHGASRTDAGVHALGQLVVFEPPGSIPIQGLLRGLNAQLRAPDLVVTAAWEEHRPGGVPVDVRKENLGKHYRYRIRCTQVRDPLASAREWHLRRRLDPAPMLDAAARLQGTHDFGSFRASGCQARTTKRTLDAVEFKWGAAAVGPLEDPGRLDSILADGATPGCGPDWIEIHVRGQAFLYNMVRIIVGTLVEVGVGRHAPGWIEQLLATPDRTRAGTTAPAAGLTLVEVLWPRRRHALAPSPSSRVKPIPNTNKHPESAK